MDARAFAAPKGLLPRRRVKPAYDAEVLAGAIRQCGETTSPAAHV
jgi:hypothetical protein